MSSVTRGSLGLVLGAGAIAAPTALRAAGDLSKVTLRVGDQVGRCIARDTCVAVLPR